MNPSLIAATAATDTNAAPAKPVRPEVAEGVKEQVTSWWNRTDNLTQRANALFEFREANKSLFPARFDPTDPRRGQTQHELKNGKDDRRVRVPYIYRDGLQITALTVPSDFAFGYEAKPQVKPPQMPGMPPPDTTNPMTQTFAETLEIIERDLLDEAGFIKKAQAWAQDAYTYPAAILKWSFRRQYNAESLNPVPGDKDESDALAELQSLMSLYADKEFDKNDARYQQMLDLLASLKAKARIQRWYGIELQRVPLDAFGISEDALDLVDIYDAAFMFHDALITGEQILKDNPFTTGADGNTYGVLPEELTAAQPWDTNNTSTDPNSKNRASRNKQRTAPTITPGQTGVVGTQGVDPKKRLYLVREIHSKRDRTVYTLIRGISHVVRKEIPQRTSRRWYRFAVAVPNRVPNEIYGASDVELKRDIQHRIHRKRTDEEKSRNLSLPRGVYNKAAGVDEKEMVKLSNIPEGQMRGINFGTTQQKIEDLVMWLKYQHTPEAFNTSQDERDMATMGALPTQSLGATGVANYATEVTVASQGAQVATKFRQDNLKRELEGMIEAIGEELLQELTVEEVRNIAGPFANWPEVYDEDEALQIVTEARERARQQVAPQALSVIVPLLQQGAPLGQDDLAKQVETLAEPVFQAEMVQRFGSVEPTTRESLFRRLRVKVHSSFTAELDAQTKVQQLAMLAEALMQVAQACQVSGMPFNPKAVLEQHAILLGGEATIDKAFPTVSPMMIAQHLAQQMLAAAKPPAPGGKNPDLQGNPAKQPDPAQNAINGQQAAPTPMG